MAGKVGRQGRKSKAEEFGYHEKRGELEEFLEGWGDTLDSVRAYLARLNTALIRRLCDTVAHKQLLDAAKAQLRSLEKDREALQLDELKQLYENAKELQRAAWKRAGETRARKNATLGE